MPRNRVGSKQLREEWRCYRWLNAVVTGMLKGINYLGIGFGGEDNGLPQRTLDGMCNEVWCYCGGGLWLNQCRLQLQIGLFLTELARKF